LIERLFVKYLKIQVTIFPNIIRICKYLSRKILFHVKYLENTKKTKNNMNILLKTLKKLKILKY